MKKLKIVMQILLVFLLAAFFAYNAAIKLGEGSLSELTVRGVDVSSYQGEINWKTLEKEDISFAFIKATEGSSYKDRCFEENIKNISKTKICAGAYHFMSFESDGKSQAKNFISSVNKRDVDLPPVIDVELYGNYNDKPPRASDVRKILDDMVEVLYAEYGRYPIIYTNRRAYVLYIAGEYENCDIWICDLTKKPVLPDEREWRFWQYSHTETLPGYKGGEEHIDMNVFNGDKKEFRQYVKGKN